MHEPARVRILITGCSDPAYWYINMIGSVILAKLTTENGDQRFITHISSHARGYIVFGDAMIIGDE